MQATDSWGAAMGRARKVALECGQGRVAPVHMAIAALETPDDLTDAVLRALGLESSSLAAALREAAPRGTYEVDEAHGPDLAYSDTGRHVLYAYREEAAAMGHRVVHPLHVLLAVLRDPAAKAGRTLRRAGVDPGAVEAAFRAEVP